MAQTFNSSVQFVEDGDTTSHTTNSNINVQSAEIRWRGSTRTETFTTINTNTNELSYTTINSGGAKFWEYDIPDKPNGTFKNHAFILFTQGDEHNTEWVLSSTFEIYDPITSTVDYSEGPKDVTLQPHDSVERGIQVSNDITTDYTGNAPGGDPWRARLSIDDTNTDVNVKPAIDTRATEQNTNTYKTKNPSVSGDVSGSYSGTLNDGEWSPWQTLSGLTEGTNTFNHSIQESAEADFEFTYTYELDFPDAVYQARYGDTDDSTIYKIAVADPSDGALQYTHVRVSMNGNDYVLDCVDPSDADAISEGPFFGSPNHPDVVPRAYDQV